jgi:hypothetical protein
MQTGADIPRRTDVSISPSFGHQRTPMTGAIKVSFPTTPVSTNTPNVRFSQVGFGHVDGPTLGYSEGP